MPAGRPGLSYAAPFKPLLKVVAGRSRATYHKSMSEDIGDSPSPASSHGDCARPFKRGVSDPISDSESSVTRSHIRHSVESDSDDTDEERRSRAAISRTTFGPSNPVQRASISPRRRPRVASGESAAENTRGQTQTKRRKLVEEGSSVSTSPKRRPMTSSQQSRASEPSSSAGSHLSESNGFTRRHGVKNTYGAGKKVATKVSSRSSDLQKQASSKAKPKSLPTTFKYFPGSDDEHSSPKRVAKFKIPEDLPPSPSPPPAKFKSYSDDLLSPSPKVQAKFIFPASLEPLDSETKSPSASKSTFKYYSESEDVQSADLGEFDESFASLLETDSEVEALFTDDKNPGKVALKITVCPWCGESVDEVFYKEFSKGTRMNVQQQTMFCRKHKKQTALDTWRSKSYPSIDWDEMPSRISSHHDFLARIVNGQPSYYRTELAKKVESGEARAMKKEDNLNPGYYGPRGFNMMCDLLVRKFTRLLKERAIHDPVISGRGSAAFIQYVLVAELAVQLIMSDMSVSAEEARTIMEDSKALGEMVHDE